MRLHKLLGRAYIPGAEPLIWISQPVSGFVMRVYNAVVAV
jgi:hypothetical protein